MPTFSQTHIARYCAKDAFELVADIERYPEFVPMCSNLVICSQQKTGSREHILADMDIAYKIIRESFTSEIVLDRGKMEIDVRNIKGPFSYLQNKWVFTDIGPCLSEIQFSIEYEFKNRMLGLIMGNMFSLVFSRFIASFDRRADKIYGA